MYDEHFDTAAFESSNESAGAKNISTGSLPKIKQCIARTPRLKPPVTTSSPYNIASPAAPTANAAPTTFIGGPFVGAGDSADPVRMLHSATLMLEI